MEKSKSKIKFYSVLFFLFSLGVFSILFFVERHFMTNFDEMDHLADVFLMSGGERLYSNIFTTHFPFPYYWLQPFSSFIINAPFNRAISFFRLSLLFLYLIVFCLIYHFIKKQKSKNLFSFWIILLGIFASLYHGNLLLSETFVAIVVFAIFWLVYPILIGEEKVNLLKLSILCLLIGASFWTQPLTLILFPIPFLLAKKEERKYPVIFLGLFISLPLLVLILNGQINSFYEQTLWFNFKIYSSNFPEKIKNYSMFTQSIFSFIKNEVFLFTHFRSVVELFQFIIHLFIFIPLFRFIKEKKYLALFIFLLLVGSTRIREIKIIPGKIFNFGIFPFLCLASANAVIMIGNFCHKKIAVFSLIVLLLVALLPSKPIILQSLKQGYNYHIFWSNRQEKGEIISILSYKNEKILVYPNDVDLYFFSKRRPIDNFTYWFPWINSVEKYRDERIMALKDTPPPVIYQGSLNYKDEPNYYGQFFPNLLDNYLAVFKNGKQTEIWLRKDLTDRLKNNDTLSVYE